MTPSLRPARRADVPAIASLIARSVHGLQAGDYDAAQREGALGSVFGVDRQLIADGTYFVVEAQSGLAGCGGWSRRATLYGSDDATVRDASLLRPGIDAARIRAFFVDPAFARQGIGSRLMRASEAAARAEGFPALELMATLTGVALYRAHGFVAVEPGEALLANGAVMPMVRMRKALG